MSGGMGSMHRKTFVLMEMLVSEDGEEDFYRTYLV